MGIKWQENFEISKALIIMREKVLKLWASLLPNVKVKRLNGWDKRRLIKEIFRQENLDIVILMETNGGDFDFQFIGGLWKSRRVDWESLNSIGKSGGILLMWNNRVLPP